MPAIVKTVVQILILAGLTALILLLLVRFGVLEPAIRWTLGNDNWIVFKDTTASVPNRTVTSCTHLYPPIRDGGE
jgi:hypothetical protein